MTLFRGQDRKSTKTSLRRLPKRKTAASDSKAEGMPRGKRERGRGTEEIDDEFRQRRVVAAELVRCVRGDCGHIPVRKTARACRGTPGFVTRAHRSQGAEGLRRSAQHAVFDRAGRGL